MTGERVGILVLAIFHSVLSDHVFFRSLASCSRDYKFVTDVNVTTTAASRIDCLKGCATHTWCRGANICLVNGHPKLQCELLGAASGQSCGSLQAEPGCSYREKVPEANPCQNGGTYVESSATCICVFGFTGQFCERRYYDCSEAYLMGERVAGHITPLVIQPLTSPSPFTVSCYLAWGGFTFIEKRMGGACPDVDFNVTWAELKHFIGDVECSYWLGLEHIHQLTQQNTYMLDMYITSHYGFGGHALYSDFSLDSEGQGYKFNYNVYVRHGYPADDGFAYGSGNDVNGFNFSTLDRPDPDECVRGGAAWWYGSSCPEVNLHMPMQTGGIANPATWVNAGTEIEVTTLMFQLSTTWP